MGLSEVFEAHRPEGWERCKVAARFYPYRDLRHTWRVSRGRVDLRVSDYLEGAPARVLEDLGVYLWARIARRPVPVAAKRRYDRYTAQRAFWAQHRAAYLARGHNLLGSPEGTWRDLRVGFEALNRVYFAGRLERPDLTWTRLRSRTRFGYSHPPLNLLVISRIFDDSRIPSFVLDYLLYHELLHFTLGAEVRGSYQLWHSAEFRQAEHAFPRWEEAESWLQEIADGRAPRGRLSSEKKPCVPRA